MLADVDEILHVGSKTERRLFMVTLKEHFLILDHRLFLSLE